MVVVGYRGDLIRKHLGSRARYVENARFEATNSLYSLWLARDELRSGSLVLNSDVLAPPALFARLLESEAADAIVVERGSGFEAEDMKVTLEGERAVDFGKDLPADRSHAHNVGVAKFSQVGGRHLADSLTHLVETGHENDWVPVAFREFAVQWPLAVVATEDLPWIEIDYPADLSRARLAIQPAIAALSAMPPIPCIAEVT